MMNSAKIRKNAEKVLRELCANSLWTFEELGKATDLSGPELYMAIGWLANDDRISFVDIKGEVLITSANIYI